MNTMLKQRLAGIEARIEKAAQHCGRQPSTIRLVAVSKTKPAEMVRRAAAAGATLLGENYIQEAREKAEILKDLDLTWHFIGHLQSNKAKYAVRIFDLIHSVDSLKLAKAIDKEAARIDKVQPVLIQVNIGEEKTKSGALADEAMNLVRRAGAMPNLSVKGLMTIPPFFDSPERVRPYFAALRRLRDTIAAEQIPGVSMKELSMGMTGDFEAAIGEGATLVRIGTAIFGSRQ